MVNKQLKCNDRGLSCYNVVIISMLDLTCKFEKSIISWQSCCLVGSSTAEANFGSSVLYFDIVNICRDKNNFIGLIN